MKNSLPAMPVTCSKVGPRRLEPSRKGISLFEVVLALSIFIGALAALTQVLRTGSRASVRAQLQSEAVLLAEQKMNEIVAGVQTLEAVSRAPLGDKGKWSWSLEIGDSGTVNLLRLEVIVEHAGENGNNTATYRLVRLMRDPQVYIDAANEAAAAASSSSSTSSTATGGR